MGGVKTLDEILAAADRQVEAALDDAELDRASFRYTEELGALFRVARQAATAKDPVPATTLLDAMATAHATGSYWVEIGVILSVSGALDR